MRVRDVAVDGIHGLCARRFYSERGVGVSTDRQFSRRGSVQRATCDSREAIVGFVFIFFLLFAANNFFFYDSFCAICIYTTFAVSLTAYSIFLIRHFFLFVFFFRTVVYNAHLPD